jgi:hypothetical protein
MFIIDSTRKRALLHKIQDIHMQEIYKHEKNGEQKLK